MLKRLLVNVAVIVVCVGGALYFFSREGPSRDYSWQPTQPQNTSPWHLTDELKGEANANFHVDSDTPREALAGKQTGFDWPQFAGPERNNRASDYRLLRDWKAEVPKLEWTATGVGIGYSSVSVVDGTIYTMGNKGETEAVIALDLGSGAKLWSTPIAWASRLSSGDGPRSTPAVYRDAVYALGGNGDLACLDARSGVVRWQKNILKEFQGKIPSWGIAESPLLDDNRLICTPGGDLATLVALEPSTGSVIWKSLLPTKDRAGYASVLPMQVGKIRQYVQFTATGTVGVRAESGELLWRDTSSANGTANCSSPIKNGDCVLTSSNYGTGTSLVKLAEQGSKVQSFLVFHTSALASHHGDLTVVNGHVFGSHGDGPLTCLNLTTGKVVWRTRSVKKGSICASGGRLYCRDEDGVVVLAEASADGYLELGRLKPPLRSKSPAWPHPVIADGRLLLRDEDYLLCYNLRPAESR